MEDVRTILVTLLKTFGFPVKLQGSLTKDEPYPESFFTIWNNDSYDGNHYDNNAVSNIWNFDVNFYSSNRNLVLTKLLEAKTLLKQNGFIVSGSGYDIASDEPTHTGRGMNVLFRENLK